MAIVASGAFSGTEFSERARQGARARFKPRIDLVAAEAVLLGVSVLRCMSQSLGKQVPSADRRLASRKLQHHYEFVPPLGRDEVEGWVKKYEKSGIQVWSMYA